MPFLLRRRRRPACEEDLGLVSVVVYADADEAAERALRATREAARATLRRVVAEALIRQDAAEELLRELRHDRELASIAPRAGRLKLAFVQLRDAVPDPSGDPELERQVAILRPILDHHLLLLNATLELLVGALRSERAAEQLDRVSGLGDPGRRLEDLAASVLGFAETA